MSFAEKIVNLTPHDVHVFLSGINATTTIVFPASGRVARLLSAPQRNLRTLDGNCDLEIWTPQTFIGFEDHGFAPLGKRNAADTSPDSFNADGVIVSMPVGEFLRAQPPADRHPAWSKVNVYGPDMGPDAAVRNEKGVILGTKRLVQYL